jgi:adenylyltransferase/sulfurtransferase
MTDSHLSSEEVLRYSRHLTLPDFGIEGQIKLKQASVLAVGAGGLGSPLLSYLAAAGVGRIGIVDFDIVEESNLQRQIIHGLDWIGRSKVDSAHHRLKEINPYCIIDTYNVRVDSNNILDIIDSYDIVCDGTDNFPTRYLVNDACVIKRKPYVYGSIFQFEGQVSVFNLHPSSPNYRDLVPEPPPAGMVPSCAEGGVVGVLPGIIGTIQATEVIKIITNIGSCLDGRLLLFNALEMSFRELKLKKNKRVDEIKSLIDYESFCDPLGTISSSVDSIDPIDLSNKFKNGSHDILLIDVRSKQERDICSISGSLHIPLDSICDSKNIDNLKSISNQNNIVIYCKLGSRSQKAVASLSNFGIRSTNLKGGIIRWIKEIDSSLSLY